MAATTATTPAPAPAPMPAVVPTFPPDPSGSTEAAYPNYLKIETPDPVAVAAESTLPVAPTVPPAKTVVEA